MRFLRRVLLKFLIAYVGDYIRKGVKSMANAKSTAGIKSTEFWITMVGAVIPVLNKYLNLNLPTNEILSILGIILAYVGSRTVIKSKGQA